MNLAPRPLGGRFFGSLCIAAGASPSLEKASSQDDVLRASMISGLGSIFSPALRGSQHALHLG